MSNTTNLTEPVTTEFPKPGSLKTLGNQFVAMNYFYLLSAAFMLAGCYMLIRSDLITGTEFTRNLKALLLLQAYELLVILSAIAIVRRFRVADDAVMLLVAEIALLVDLAFYSNAFFTMRTPESAAVNFVVFFLAPLKMLVLLRHLRIRFSRRAWITFLIAAAIVHLGCGPMNIGKDPFAQALYLYMLGWTPMLIIFAMPERKNFVEFKQSGSSANLTHAPGQRKWLVATLASVPLAAAIFHYMEGALLYEVHLFAVYLAPLLGCACLVLVRLLPDLKKSNQSFVLDLAVIAGALVSIPAINLALNVYSLDPVGTRFLNQIINVWSLAIFGVAAIVIYGYAFWKHSWMGGWLRVMAIIVGGVLFGVKELLVISGRTLVAHPTLIVIMIIIGLTLLAMHFRHIMLWMLVWVPTTWLAFVLLPVNAAEWAPELIQIWLGAALALAFALQVKSPAVRATLATLLILFSGGRLLFDPSWLFAALMASHVLIAMILAKCFAMPELKKVASLGAGLEALILMVHLHVQINAATAVISIALILFVLGLIVTWQKDECLAEKALAPDPSDAEVT